MEVVSDNKKYFVNSKLGCIIVTSDEPWSDVWMPQLHYAYQLSKRYNVIFLGPPATWSIRSLFRLKHEAKKYNDRLIVINYLNVLPLFIGKLAVFINDLINQKLISKKITVNSKLPDLIMWRFDPFRSMYIYNDKNKARQVFHVIDPIAGKDLDIPLTKMSELVITTSPKFMDHYKALNKKVILLRQGVDIDFYNSAVTSEDINSSIAKDSVLLLGSFTDDIDYLFLKKIADHISTNLVFIGPMKILKHEKVTQFNDLIGKDNVHWLGPMEPNKFLSYLKACNVGIISYDHDNNPNNKFRSPLKAIGYLAAHKCIISNIDCEIPSLQNKAIYILNDEQAYLKLLDKSFAGSLLFDEEAVKRYLASIDYDNLIALAFSSLGKEFSPKV